MIMRHHLYGLHFKSSNKEHGFVLIIRNSDKTKQWMHIGFDNTILVSKRVTIFEKVLYKLIQNRNYYCLSHGKVLRYLKIKKVIYKKL